jgi:uncharacterized protein
LNRLNQEQSPYLLQHAHNPVDWYAWKPEAFERARAEQKPILVSIGYSTCHWCHVMERESFENPDVAAMMNEWFVNIKVDREERPDVDAIYMEACQILTGGGGWPLNCFLTPEGKPFFAGTYYPPRPAFNRPSWPQVLQHLRRVWQEQRETALDQAEKLLGHIRNNDDVFIGREPDPVAPGFASELTDVSAKAALEGEMRLQNIFYKMRERFDRRDGGFGGAPKFPSTMALQYLLEYQYYTNSPEALDHVHLTLGKMVGGGIYDQLGGGFSRYATDSAWLVPHFEKMLYDNALLVGVLSETYKILGVEGGGRKVEGGGWKTEGASQPSTLYPLPSTLIKETIEETLEYVAREMTHPDGGFYAAQDADSEGVEGKFYVWDQSEIETLLGEEAPLFCAFYGVTKEGNWEEKNILWRPVSYEAFARHNQLEVDLLKKRLKKSRQTLLAARSKRIYPGLDDKVILGWNALMCSAYIQAYTALGHDYYKTAALRNLDFCLKNFASPPAALHPLPSAAPLKHSWKNGHAQYDAFLDDYAFLIAALVDAYQITFDLRYLQTAEKYTGFVLSYFFDPESGLFFYTGAQQTDVVLRKKDLYDNATPSGNSTMTHNLQRLGILLDRRDWREHAGHMVETMRGTIERFPMSFERWCAAMLHEIRPANEIAVIGDNAMEKAVSLQRRFIPNKVVAASEKPSEELPLLAGKTGEPDALIYVCRDFVCRQPVVQAEDLEI